MDGIPNRRNRAAFSNFFGVRGTVPENRCMLETRLPLGLTIPLIYFSTGARLGYCI